MPHIYIYIIIVVVNYKWYWITLLRTFNFLIDSKRVPRWSKHGTYTAVHPTRPTAQQVTSFDFQKTKCRARYILTTARQIKCTHFPQPLFSSTLLFAVPPIDGARSIMCLPPQTMWPAELCGLWPHLLHGTAAEKVLQIRSFLDFCSDAGHDVCRKPRPPRFFCSTEQTIATAKDTTHTPPAMEKPAQTDDSTSSSSSNRDGRALDLRRFFRIYF